MANVPGYRRHAPLGPQRVEIFRSMIQDPDRPVSSLWVSCKLLIDETVNLDEGQMDRLIKGPLDFDRCRSDEALRRKLLVVGAENAEEFDAEEFFYFCVPATVLFCESLCLWNSRRSR